MTQCSKESNGLSPKERANIMTTVKETVVTSEAIGRKKIHVLDTAITTAVGSTTRIRLTIGHAVALPMVTQFAVFAPCPSK